MPPEILEAALSNPAPSAQHSVPGFIKNRVPKIFNRTRHE